MEVKEVEGKEAKKRRKQVRDSTRNFVRTGGLANTSDIQETSKSLLRARQRAEVLPSSNCRTSLCEKFGSCHRKLASDHF